MFYFVTGKPGSGKTSFTLDRIIFTKEFHGRDVYYRGIPELATDKVKEIQGGTWVELSDDDAKRWHEVASSGAVIIIDEAQELWRTRSASSAVPPGIVALERHRHQGWDVFFMSQDGQLVDHNARKLCNQHYHYSRLFNARVILEYQSASGYVNIGNGHGLAQMAKSSRPQPKRVFDLYKSAEVHTHKFRLPRQVYYALGVLALVPVGIWYLFHMMRADIPVDVVPEPAGQAVVESASAPAPGLGPGRASHSYAVDWETAFTPAVAGLPFTAPLYRDLAATPLDLPRISGCMAFENDQSDCRCYTQQGTRIWDMHASICKRILVGGLFDPYMSREESAGRRGGDVEERDTPRGGAQTSL